ncbi:hypothetical protein hairong_100 [Pseudomonas phage hairong]|nr:hypothetical protein hairong_100 [Pseudomonas phage hairong]
MNAAQNWEDEEGEQILDENQAVKYALALHLEQMAVRKKMGLPPPKYTPISIKGVPAVDPDKIAAVEVPEDYGKWA